MHVGGGAPTPQHRRKHSRPVILYKLRNNPANFPDYGIRLAVAPDAIRPLIKGVNSITGLLGRGCPDAVADVRGDNLVTSCRGRQMDSERWTNVVGPRWRTGSKITRLQHHSQQFDLLRRVSKCFWRLCRTTPTQDAIKTEDRDEEAAMSIETLFFQFKWFWFSSVFLHRLKIVRLTPHNQGGVSEPY